MTITFFSSNKRSVSARLGTLGFRMASGWKTEHSYEEAFFSHLCTVRQAA